MKRISSVFNRMSFVEKLAVYLLAVVFALSVFSFIRSRIISSVSHESNIYTEGTIGHVGSLNPLYIDFNDTDRDLARLIFSGLVRYDPEKKEIVPDLATSWERSANGLSYTFVVREDALFHDGIPVTVGDIIFTFRDVINHPQFTNPILKKTFEGVSIRSASPTTITFTLPKQNSYFISYLGVGILPKHLLENELLGNLQQSAFNKQPVGSGPYQVTSARLGVDGDAVTLKAFAAYYGTKPSLDTIRVFTFPDEDALLKETDALHGISKLNASSSTVKELASNPRFTFYPYTLPQFSALYFNTEDPILAEKSFRRALMRALDKDLILEPGARRMDTLIGDILPTDPRFIHNIEHAQGALDALGFKKGPDGLRLTPKGEPFELKFLTTPSTASMAYDIKEQWEKIGVQISVQQVETDELSDHLTDGSYSILFIRQNLGYNPDVYPLFHSSQVALGSQGLNFANFKSFRTDGLTEAIRKEKDAGDREKLMRELSNALTDEVPLIFISTPVYTYAMDRQLEPLNLENLHFHADRFNYLMYLNL